MRAKSSREPTKAIAYLRTSSTTNVGPDKDSDKRQREAIQTFADRAGLEIVAEFYDAVSGADAIENRTGFAQLLDRIEGNGVRTVIVEDASRFARDLMVQELGILSLIGRGVTVLTATGDDLTNTTDPLKVAMRQIAGAFAQLEKTRLVQKLKGARDRKSELKGKRIEGRKALAVTNPDAVALAKRLYRTSPKTGARRSLRTISKMLAEAGHLNERGQPFNPGSVKAMIEGPAPARLSEKD